MRDTSFNETLPPMIFPCQASLTLPKAATKEVNGFLEIQILSDELDYDLSDLASSRISMERKDRHTPSTYNLMTAIHDLTFCHIDKSTDVPLTKMFPGFRDCLSRELFRRTPDSFVRVDNRFVILEFTTRACYGSKDLLTAFNEKMNMTYVLDAFRCELINAGKLEQFIEKFGKPLYVVIAVGRDTVVTNLNVSDEFVNELVFRYRFCLSILSHLVKETSNTIEEDNLLTSLNKIKPTKSKIFSLKSLRSWVKSGDEETLARIEEECFSRAYDELSSDIKKDPEALFVDDLLNYKEALNSANSEFQTHLKSVVNLPLCLPKLENDYNLEAEELFFLIDEVDSPEMRLLSECKIAGTSREARNEIIDVDGDLDQVISEMEFLDSTPQDIRALYSRYRYRIESLDEIELAKVGLKGKKYKYNEEVKDYRESKKLSFNIDDDITSDIGVFLNDTKLMSKLFEPNRKMGLLPGEAEILNLIGQAFKSTDSVKFTDEIVCELREFMLTPWFKWASFVSDLATELAISLRQHCKPNEVILKKLARFRAWVIISPTNLSKHVSFCLFLPRKGTKVYDTGFVFRELFSSDQLYWTQFISVNESKIENWALMESRSLQIYKYFQDFYGLLGRKAKNKSDVIKSLRMTTLSYLFTMSDKRENEEVSTLCRHISMEAFKVNTLTPRPSKVFSKFPVKIRSRLTSFIINKFISYTSHIIKHPFEPVRDEFFENYSGSISNGGAFIQSKWKGLVNPYWLDEDLKTPGMLLNIFYMGYLVNKNQKAEANYISKLLQKIIDQESKFQRNKEVIHSFEKKPGERLEHSYDQSFCTSFVSYCLNVLLPSIHGPNYKNDVNREILQSISSATLEEFMTTLKATSNYGPEFFEYSQGFNYSRSKVIEKASEYMRRGFTRIAEILPMCLDTIRTQNAIYTCIFDKNQHGGVREIFVLTFEERIVQWVVEKISRCLCNLFQGETMTHPKNKKLIPIQHSEKARKVFRSEVLTLCTSADASKWSQTQYSHKFAFMLMSFLSPDWHPFIQVVMHLWTKKKIMIPQSLLEVMARDRKEGMNFSDDYMQDLYDGFRGIREISWIEPRSTHIKVESGMMQGILHYTSSLWHSLLNLYIEDLVLRTFSKSLNSKVVCNLMQSSDDSCMLITFEKSHDEIITSKRFLCAAVLSKMKAIMGELSGIHTSTEKTAENTPFLFEFNSTFHFSSAHYEPDIKASYACLLIGEREAMIDRCEEFYNSITTFISMGGSCLLASWHQISQSLLHYRYMGASTTPRFKILQRLLKVMPDPSIGFFLLDDPRACGLTGYQYGLWNIMMTTQMKRVMFEAIKTLKNAQVDAKGSPNIDIGKYGLLIRNKSVLFGKREKHKRLCQKMDLPEDWFNIIDRKPDLLFRKSQTVKESMAKVAMKMMQPGVVESLATGNCTARQIAFSVYCLLSKVVLLSDRIIKDTKPVKVNLLKLLSKQVRLYSEGNCHIADDDVEKMFPLHKDYILLKNIISTTPETTEEVIIDYRRVQTEVEIINRDQIGKIGLLTVLQFVWFGADPRMRRSHYSSSNLKEVFNDYSLLIPWLDNNPHKTLESSPFEHFHQMYNWLSQFEEKIRVVRISGAPLSNRRGKTFLRQAIEQNFANSLKLSGKTFGLTMERVEVKVFPKCCLALAGMSPSPELRIKQTLYEEPMISFNPQIIKSRQNTMHIIQNFVKEGEVMTYTNIEKLMRNQNGSIGLFTVRQRFDPKKKIYRGQGVWEGYFGTHQVRITILESGGISYVSSIEFDSVFNYGDVEPQLIQWCRENKTEIWTMKTYFKGSVSFFDGSKCKTSQGGAPIYINSNLKRDLELKCRNYKFECIRNVLRIVTDDVYRLTIVSLSLRISDYAPSIGEEPFFCNSESDDFFRRCWYGNIPCSLSDSQNLLQSVMCGSFCEDTEKREFIKECFKGALSRVGIHTMVVDPTEKLFAMSDNQPSSMNGIQLELLDDDLFNIDNLCSDLKDIEPLEEYEDDNFLDFQDIFSPSRRVDLDLKTYVRKTHPLFRNYVEKLLDQDIRSHALMRLKRLFNRGEADPSVEKLIPLAEFILDRSIIKIQSSLPVASSGKVVWG